MYQLAKAPKPCRATIVARRFYDGFASAATKLDGRVGVKRRARSVHGVTRAARQQRRNGVNRPYRTCHVTETVGHVAPELTSSSVTNCAGAWCSWRQRPAEPRSAAPSFPPAPQMRTQHVPACWRAAGVLARLASSRKSVCSSTRRTSIAARDLPQSIHPADRAMCPP